MDDPKKAPMCGAENENVDFYELFRDFYQRINRPVDETYIPVLYKNLKREKFSLDLVANCLDSIGKDMVSQNLFGQIFKMRRDVRVKTMPEDDWKNVPAPTKQEFIDKVKMGNLLFKCTNQLMAKFEGAEYMSELDKFNNKYWFPYQDNIKALISSLQRFIQLETEEVPFIT